MLVESYDSSDDEDQRVAVPSLIGSRVGVTPVQSVATRTSAPGLPSAAMLFSADTEMDQKREVAGHDMALSKKRATSSSLVPTSQSKGARFVDKTFGILMFQQPTPRQALQR